MPEAIRDIARRGWWVRQDLTLSYSVYARCGSGPLLYVGGFWCEGRWWSESFQSAYFMGEQWSYSRADGWNCDQEGNPSATGFQGESYSGFRQADKRQWQRLELPVLLERIIGEAWDRADEGDEEP